MRIRLILEYDGTAYAGWQVQPNGVSVQGVVEAALARITGEELRLHSSGRTDAGVHARGMVVHFTPSRDLPLAAYREGLNRLLPSDIAVRRAEPAADDFHARFDATGKWYRYTLQAGPVRSPLAARTSWHIRGRLDLDAMREGASAFVGRHDFRAFRGAGCEAQTTERTIFALELLEQGELLHFDVRGEGFLRNMVRTMVGTLVEIGLGRRPAADVAGRLADGVREWAGRTAPPQGLCLMEVYYGEVPLKTSEGGV